MRVALFVTCLSDTLYPWTGQAVARLLRRLGYTSMWTGVTPGDGPQDFHLVLLDNERTATLAETLPFASTLCGACYDACPVRINIPEVLTHLRARVVEQKRRAIPGPEAQAMAAAAVVFSSARLLRAVQWLAWRGGRLLARRGVIRRLPLAGRAWTGGRDLLAPAAPTFRTWWRQQGRREDGR